MIHRHIDGVSVKADFSADKRYRYRLDISKLSAKESGQSVCAIMQNPSYANEAVADKSVQCLEKVIFTQNLSEFERVNTLIVVNQFAYIQTNGFTADSEKIGIRNNRAIETAIEQADIILIAWGCANRFIERQAFVYDLLKNMPQKILLKTRSHPSRARYSGFILPCDVFTPSR